MVAGGRELAQLSIERNNPNINYDTALIFA